SEATTGPQRPTTHGETPGGAGNQRRRLMTWFLSRWGNGSYRAGELATGSNCNSGLEVDMNSDAFFKIVASPDAAWSSGDKKCNPQPLCALRCPGKRFSQVFG